MKTISSKSVNIKKYHRGRHSFLVVVVVVVAMVGDVNVDFVARPVVLVGVET